MKLFAFLIGAALYSVNAIQVGATKNLRLASHKQDSSSSSSSWESVEHKQEDGSS